MKNTTVLIDGFNLYYGLLKGTQWKWLDLVSFSQALLGDDHNILAVMLEAAKPEVDGIALITGDSDQVGAIEAARYVYGKRVLVFNPHPGLSTNLKRAASYYKNIPRDLPARCQLPDAIPVGTHGNFIRRPAAWK